MPAIGYAGKDPEDKPFSVKIKWAKGRDISGYSAAFIEQARQARARAEKMEKRRDGLLKFKRRFMPEWARLIVEEIADKHDICPSAIATDDRRHKVIRARNEAIYLIKCHRPELSTPKIGGWFNKDHTSILHALASHSDKTGAPRMVGYNLAEVRARNRNRARASKLKLGDEGTK
jgi:hypothetical protein